MDIIAFSQNDDSRMYRICSIFMRRFLPLGLFRPGHPFWSLALPVQFRRAKYSHVWRYAPKCPTYSIDCKYNEIDCDIREFYRTFFDALRPSEEVQRRISSISIPKNAVAVQIRNSGTVSDKKDVAELKRFISVMDGYPEDTYFFISAMHKNISDKFRRLYGKRCLELPGKDYGSMIDAVADMWLLGHCGNEMIVSPGSTFSEIAWWWGGATSRVAQLSADYNQKNGLKHFNE